jgi:anti-sigma B factor antagonist
MNCTNEKEGETIVLKVTGSINSQTADDFKAAISALLPAPKLIIDFSGVDYISSAGLRILMWANGQFPAKAMVVRHVCEEVFTMTGFSSFLTIE